MISTEITSLADTYRLMQSEDYKDRFKAEYYQTVIRFDKLYQMLAKYEDGSLEFELTCPKKLLIEQKYAMLRYIGILEDRAKIEGIEL